MNQIADKILKVAMVQFSRDRFNSARNRERALEMLSGIRNVDVVCMPEVWMGAVIIEENELSTLLDDISAVAKENGMSIITGGLFIREDGWPADVCHLVGSDGVVAGRQQKIFPSGAVGERQYCRGGNKLQLFEIAGVKIGVAICVDMFYPEIIRAMALDGAEVVLNPSNIPEARIELWHSLVRTRAAENTIHTIFVNNTNTEYADGRKVMGESLAAGPDGINTVALDKDECIHIIEVDISQIYRQRKRWVYLEDIRGMKPIANSAVTGHALTPTDVTHSSELD